MDTRELVQVVRDKLFEYQEDPLSDGYLIRMLEEAYRMIYQHIVRANDTYFAQEHLLQVQNGITMYDLPTILMGKRVEAVFIPTPPQESMSPWGWFRLRKVDFKQSSTYQSTRIRTYYPSVWSTLNNKIYFFPMPLVNYTARLIVSRRLVPLGVLTGRITDLGNNIITVDQFGDDNLQSALDDVSLAPSRAYISVSDFQTGEVKALFYYTGVNASTREITLGAPVRASYQGHPVAALPGTDWASLGIAVDDLVTVGYTTGKPLTSEEFDYLLINWAVLSVRGSLNEADNEATQALKLELQNMVGDLAGRETGISISRTAYTQPNFPMARRIRR